MAFKERVLACAAFIAFAAAKEDGCTFGGKKIPAEEVALEALKNFGPCSAKGMTFEQKLSNGRSNFVQEDPAVVDNACKAIEKVCARKDDVIAAFKNGVDNGVVLIREDAARGVAIAVEAGCRRWRIDFRVECPEDTYAFLKSLGQKGKVYYETGDTKGEGTRVNLPNVCAYVPYDP